MELDFSKLEQLAYRGFDGAEARAQKDALIEQGFTILEDEETPFESTKGQEANTSATPPIRPSKRKLEPLTGMDASRDYRAMYRAACNYHERHNPPKVDSEYWKSHTPGEDETPQAELDYWEEAAYSVSEAASAFQRDPFIIGLLAVVYDELEREYIAKREAVALHKALDKR